VKQKGTGVSGKGLQARIIDWENIRGVGGGHNTKLVMSPSGRLMCYHKPGSQNPRKGGLTKSQRKLAAYR
jgi:hypothetical protein